MDRYDIVVLGSGPAGHFGAIQAAKLGKSAIIVEQHDRVGGVSATTGTLPSKALREATLHLTGLRERVFYGVGYMPDEEITVQDLLARTAQVVRNETSVLEAQLRRNRVKVVHGRGRLDGAHRVVVETALGRQEIEAETILIAVGSRPSHPPGIAFDGRRIIDSSQILDLTVLPRRLTVVGAGVIGVEYACIFAALGCDVTLVDARNDILEFVDRQVVDALKYHMQGRDVEIYLGEKVVSLEVRGAEVVARTHSNKTLTSDCLLYSVGRRANTDGLGLESLGVTTDERGRIAVNQFYQTTVPHIYAAGDVIGFPALAATSREQGRLAVCHALGAGDARPASRVPYGIYAIPEISMIGPTEQELTKRGVPYETGVAHYREIARGQLLGDTEGFLKVLFEPDSLKVIGVHIIGEGATELIHIGQAVEASGGTLHYFADAVFNYPTLAECYKVAALDGLNRVATAQAPSEAG